MLRHGLSFALRQGPVYCSMERTSAAIARMAGFPVTATISGPDEADAGATKLRAAQGPVMVVFKVAADRDPLVLPSWDGPLLKNRFREALLGGQPAD